MMKMDCLGGAGQGETYGQGRSGAGNKQLPQIDQEIFAWLLEKGQPCKLFA
jgi:hypothetical protein